MMMDTASRGQASFTAVDNLARLGLLAEVLDSSSIILGNPEKTTRATINLYTGSRSNRQPHTSLSSSSMNADTTGENYYLKRQLGESGTTETPLGSHGRLRQQQASLLAQSAPFLTQQLELLNAGLSQNAHDQRTESNKRQKLMDGWAHHHHDEGGDCEDTDDAERDDDSSNEEDAEASHGVRFREYQAEIWSEKFEELCAFRRVHQHCHVPHQYKDNSSLAQWVKRQRYQFKLKMEGKHSTLSDERIRLLNTIGFIWNSHDAVWEERLQDLLQFKMSQGHCIVPSNYEPNIQLAVWTKRQRRQYKKYQEGSASSMTPERIAKLEQVGFVWDCRTNNKTPTPEEEHNLVGATSGVSTNPHLDDENRVSTLVNWNVPNDTNLPYENDKEKGEGEGPEGGRNMVAAIGGMSASSSSAGPSSSSGSIGRRIDLSIMANKELESSQSPKKMPKCDFFSFSRSYSTSNARKLQYEV